MNRKSTLTMVLLAAAGTVATVQSTTLGAAKVVNISGATLMENFIKAPGSTNDYIDVDGDGIAGSLGSFSPDQLAPFDATLGYNSAGQIWVIQYRVVGSVAGLQELIDFGCPNADGTANGVGGGIESNVNSITNAYHNRTQYISGGVGSGIFNAANPGGAPVRSLNPGGGDYSATTTTGGATGIQIDISPVDVPALYAVTKPGGSASPFLKPTQLGYGLNPSPSRDKLTGALTGASQQLAALTGGRNLDAPGHTPDANTIYDTPLAYVPIAAMVNLGVGKSQITMTDLRYSNLTGRLHTGQNLTQVTRESGSGTRNGFCNSIGIDPSWGRGDNVGITTSGGSPDPRLVGAGYSPTNKVGSGDVETTVRNTRIAIGYTGAERNLSLITGARSEILAVKNDIYPGATEYSRPNIDEVYANDVNGYRIGGFGVICSIGDPKAESIANGGESNGNPDMCNPAAADYLNNIRQSIANFVAVPGSPDNEFMPGEVGATLFVFPDALDYVNIDNPGDVPVDPNLWYSQTPNTNLRAAINAVTVLNDPPFYTFGATTLTGQTPNRVAGTYTDGNTGTHYVLNDGTTVAYNTTSGFNNRNRIAGDMNGDGLRDWNDAVELVKATQARNDGPGGLVWSAPDGIWGAGSGLKASPEILADFNCDGNLTNADVRFWADGFALQPTGSNENEGNLNRVEGFTRVDNAAVAPVAGNFFGTTLANPGATYNAGDSRADVAGSGGTVPGWAPVGADGEIDGDDIDYVYENFGDWTVLADAVRIDLSCDMDGDLDVDQDDVCTILSILETTIRDVNLDGVVNATDLTIANSHLNIPGTWGFEGGDVNGDGAVTAADISIINGTASDPCNPAPACQGDVNGDGDTNTADFNILAGNFGTAVTPGTNGDLTGDGFVNASDFNILAGGFGCTTP